MIYVYSLLRAVHSLLYESDLLKIFIQSSHPLPCVVLPLSFKAPPQPSLLTLILVFFTLDNIEFLQPFKNTTCSLAQNSICAYLLEHNSSLSPSFVCYYSPFTVYLRHCLLNNYTPPTAPDLPPVASNLLKLIFNSSRSTHHTQLFTMCFMLHS